MSEENFKILSIQKSGLWKRFWTIKDLCVLAEYQGKTYKVNVRSGNPPNLEIVNRVADEVRKQSIKNKKPKLVFNPDVLVGHSFPLNRIWMFQREIRERIKEST